MATGDYKNGTNLTGLVLAQSQLAGTTETTVYTVSANQYVKIASLAVCNVSGSAVTVNVSIVKTGGTAGTTTRIVSGFSLGASGSATSTADITEAKGAMLGPGDFISISAGTGAAVNYTLTGSVSS